MTKYLRIAGVVWVLLAGGAHALEPERQEVVVTHNRVWDGYVYKENFVPSGQHEMLLLSGKDNAVSFVRTQEYYWPLSRQRFVAFENQYDELDGDLVITQGGQEITVVARSIYSIVYPEGARNGQGFLLWGDDAVTEFQSYGEAERAFNRRFAEARQAMSVYESLLSTAAEARLNGEDVPEIEAPPPLPEPSLKLVTEPRGAFRVVLDSGQYEAYLRREGQQITGTDRNLRVVDGSARETLVADIIPEERWTRPLPSNAPDDKIFVAPGSTFYLTLSHASRFLETEYVPLVRPQAEPVVGRDIYVRRRPAEDGKLQVAWSMQNNGIDLELVQLKVEQTGGAAFGYVVRDAEDNETPDLTAFSVSVPRETVNHKAFILAQAGGDREMRRELVVIQPRNSTLGWILAFLPILVGFGIRLRRRLGGKGH